MPYGQLKKLGEEGKITSELLANALLSSYDEISKKASNLPSTFAGAFQTIKNLYFKTVNEFRENNLFAPFILQINEFRENLEAFFNNDDIRIWSFKINSNLRYIGRIFDEFMTVLDGVANQLGITAKVGDILSIALGMIALNLTGLVAVKAVSTVMMLARGFMMLFSPLALVGIAVLGVIDVMDMLAGRTSLSGSFLLWFDESKKLQAGLLALSPVFLFILGQWLLVKVRFIGSIIAMTWAAITSAWGIAASWISANLAMTAASLVFYAIVGGLIIAFVALVIAGIYWLSENWEEIWNGLGEFLFNFVGMITEKWNEFVKSIKEGWNDVKAMIDRVKRFLGIDSTITVEGKNTTIAKIDNNALSYRPNANTVGAGVLKNDIKNSTQVTNNVSVNTPKEASEFTISQTVDAWKNPMRNATTGGVSQ